MVDPLPAAGSLMRMPLFLARTQICLHSCAVRKITDSLLLLSHHDDRQTFHACRCQSRSTVWQAQLPKPPRAKFRRTSPKRANPPRWNPPGQQESRQNDLAADRSGNIDPSYVGEDSKQQRIAQLAYSYWETRGKSEGSAEEDWFRAEAEIHGTRKPSSAASGRARKLSPTEAGC